MGTRTQQVAHYVTVLALLAGCGGDGGTTEPPPPNVNLAGNVYQLTHANGQPVPATILDAPCPAFMTVRTGPYHVELGSLRFVTGAEVDRVLVYRQTCGSQAHGTTPDSWSIHYSATGDAIRFTNPVNGLTIAEGRLSGNVITFREPAPSTGFSFEVTFTRAP